MTNELCFLNIFIIIISYLVKNNKTPNVSMIFFFSSLTLHLLGLWEQPLGADTRAAQTPSTETELPAAAVCRAPLLSDWADTWRTGGRSHLQRSEAISLHHLGICAVTDTHYRLLFMI